MKWKEMRKCLRRRWQSLDTSFVCVFVFVFVPFLLGDAGWQKWNLRGEQTAREKNERMFFVFL